MAAAMADGVADAALHWFAESSDCRRKIPTTHWTVFAAIVVVSTPPLESADNAATADGDATAPSEPPMTYRVLAAATGTKCLGQRDLHASGLVVNDCHAEVLARRALVRYLYTEALAWAAGCEDSNTSLFERHATTQRLALKPQHSLHLFISEAPCGDAAIYELRDDVVDELVKQRVRRSDAAEAMRSDAVAADDIERSAFRLTGAKAKRKRDSEHDHDLHTSKQMRDTSAQQSDQTTAAVAQPTSREETRFDQIEGIARVKSGRSDLPADKQTLSMSCSDKLAKWHALGVQGALLLQCYDPLFLSAIVVLRDATSASADAQLAALQRAVVGRLTYTNRPCELHVVDSSATFDRQRTSGRAASPLALNWTLCEPHWRNAIDATVWTDATASDSNDSDNRQLRTFFGANDVEVLNAATGLKQGAKKLSAMSDRETLRVASRLTKRTLFRAFLAVQAAKARRCGQSTAIASLTYWQHKYGVSAANTDDDDDDPNAAARNDALRESAASARARREQFFAAIGRWVGVPVAYKQFGISSTH